MLDSLFNNLNLFMTKNQMHFSNDFKNVEVAFLLLQNLSHKCQSHTEETSGARGQTFSLSQRHRNRCVCFDKICFYEVFNVT